MPTKARSKVGYMWLLPYRYQSLHFLYWSCRYSWPQSLTTALPNPFLNCAPAVYMLPNWANLDSIRILTHRDVDQFWIGISTFTPNLSYANPDSKPGWVTCVNRAYVTTLVHLTEVLCDPKCQVWCSPPLYTCRYRENSGGYREWKCLTLIWLFVWRMWKLIIIIIF